MYILTKRIPEFVCILVLINIKKETLSVRSLERVGQSFCYLPGGMERGGAR